MLLNTDDAFPEAVDAVVDMLAPYQIHSVQHMFHVNAAHTDLLDRYPLAVVRLANALVDPTRFPPPLDLGELLDSCAQPRALDRRSSGPTEADRVCAAFGERDAS